MGLLRTGILLAALTGFFLAVGYWIGGQTGLLIAFTLAAGMNFFAWYNSDKMALKAHHAYPADPVKHRRYIQTVKRLAKRADLPMPAVYILPGDQPNAFATGRSPDKAAVAATEGLLRLMREEEVAAVMAHELAHVKNRDTLTMTISATLAGAISLLANFAFFFGGSRDRGALGLAGSLALMILAPLAAGLIQMTISRAREYEADRVGAEICGNPLWLASALERLQNGSKKLSPTAEAHPATAPMFIINPLSGRSMDRLFSTHPNTQNRIDALTEQAEAMGITSTDIKPGKRGTKTLVRQGPWGENRDQKAKGGPTHLPKSPSKSIWK